MSALPPAEVVVANDQDLYSHLVGKRSRDPELLRDALRHAIKRYKSGNILELVVRDAEYHNRLKQVIEKVLRTTGRHGAAQFPDPQVVEAINELANVYTERRGS